MHTHSVLIRTPGQDAVCACDKRARARAHTRTSVHIIVGYTQKEGDAMAHEMRTGIKRGPDFNHWDGIPALRKVHYISIHACLEVLGVIYRSCLVNREEGQERIIK